MRSGLLPQQVAPCFVSHNLALGGAQIAVQSLDVGLALSSVAALINLGVARLLLRVGRRHRSRETGGTTCVKTCAVRS